MTPDAASSLINRLRARVRALEREAEHLTAPRDGVAVERAATVTYLRTLNDPLCTLAADNIERGLHRSDPV